MNQPPLNPDAPDSQVSVDQRVEVIETPARDYPSHGAVTISLHHSERQSTTIQIAERTAESLRDQLNDHLAAVLPEVTSVDELEALPIGTVIMPLAYHSATPVLVRDQWGTWAIAGHPSPYSTEVVFLGLHGEPASVLYRPEVKP